MLLFLSFVEIKLIDIIDILLVSLLFYQLYRLVKGTAALNIFLGLVIVLYIVENCCSYPYGVAF
jgi:DNA integrity scanning protein DisA with diadenylate cyclase activity